MIRNEEQRIQSCTNKEIGRIPGLGEGEVGKAKTETEEERTQKSVWQL